MTRPKPKTPAPKERSPGLGQRTYKGNIGRRLGEGGGITESLLAGAGVTTAIVGEAPLAVGLLGLSAIARK